MIHTWDTPRQENHLDHWAWPKQLHQLLPSHLAAPTSLEVCNSTNGKLLDTGHNSRGDPRHRDRRHTSPLKNAWAMCDRFKRRKPNVTDQDSLFQHKRSALLNIPGKTNFTHRMKERRFQKARNEPHITWWSSFLSLAPHFAICMCAQDVCYLSIDTFFKYRIAKKRIANARFTMIFSFMKISGQNTSHNIPWVRSTRKGHWHLAK